MPGNRRAMPSDWFVCAGVHDAAPARESMDDRDRRMLQQHVTGFPVNEGVDLEMWRLSFQNAEYGRGEQNVAVMAQLDDERASDRA